METKLRAVLAADLRGVRVSELCRELEISRQTFYKYKRRWAAEGPAGLVERSRRPDRSPQLISARLEDEIVRLRKELPLDRGAQTIAYHLHRTGWPVPSVATIHRALVRRGLVIAQPQKRPRSAWRRFEWPQANDAWQIDATHWVLRSGREVWVMDIIDDHSRLVVAARACTGPTMNAAWDTFCDATQHWGLPARVMSDNGTCFTGRFLRGVEIDFERNLRVLGIRHLLSSPAHPQTCGKIERFHQTLKRWLATQPRARSIPQLQAQLDWFLDFYNPATPPPCPARRNPHRTLDVQPSSDSSRSDPRTTRRRVPPRLPWRRHRLVPIPHRCRRPTRRPTHPGHRPRRQHHPLPKRRAAPPAPHRPNPRIPTQRPTTRPPPTSPHLVSAMSQHNMSAMSRDITPRYPDPNRSGNPAPTATA
jgi:transposase InsO family protein